MNLNVEIAIQTPHRSKVTARYVVLRVGTRLQSKTIAKRDCDLLKIHMFSLTPKLGGPKALNASPLHRVIWRIMKNEAFPKEASAEEKCLALTFTTVCCCSYGFAREKFT